MFDRMLLRRDNAIGLSTLELKGPDSELQLKLLCRLKRAERMEFMREFLRQIQPWLRHFYEPVIDHTGRGIVREKPVGRFRIAPFEGESVTTIAGSVGSEIRNRRIGLGLTQSELAARLGIHRSHLSEIERGIHIPQVATRRKIEAILLGFDPQSGISKFQRGFES